MEESAIVFYLRWGYGMKKKDQKPAKRKIAKINIK